MTGSLIRETGRARLSITTEGVGCPHPHWAFSTSLPPNRCPHTCKPFLCHLPYCRGVKHLIVVLISICPIAPEIECIFLFYRIFVFADVLHLCPCGFILLGSLFLSLIERSSLQFHMLQILYPALSFGFGFISMWHTVWVLMWGTCCHKGDQGRGQLLRRLTQTITPQP